MFLFEDACSEGFGGVTGQGRDIGLGDYRASVVFFVHQIDADAENAFVRGVDRGVDARSPYIPSPLKLSGSNGWTYRMWLRHRVSVAGLSFFMYPANATSSALCAVRISAMAASRHAGLG